MEWVFNLYNPTEDVKNNFIDSVLENKTGNPISIAFWI